MNDPFARLGASMVRFRSSARIDGQPLPSSRSRVTKARSIEECRTPVQVIASEKNKLFPYRMVKRSYDRLGGPKELVTLSGKGMWGLSRDFNEDYCAHVIRWFNGQGAAGS
jgi:fermentation-respiration switch protein FrsA (DUF1100 family)